MYEPEDLRESVRKLKMQQQRLQNEKKLLNDELLVLEQKQHTLRVEANVLQALEEAKVEEYKESKSVADSMVSEAELQSQTFKEANMKLEVTILTADIKHALQRLEKEAILAEERAASAQRELDVQHAREKTLPESVYRNPADEALEVRKLQRKKEKLEAQLSKADEENLEAMVRSASLIHQYRKQILDMEHDILEETDRLHRNERSYNLEYQRLKHLIRERNALQAEVADIYGDDAAWQHEAYLNYAAHVEEKSIDTKTISNLLALWLPDRDTSPAYIQAYLDKLRVNAAQAMEEKQFRELCKMVEAQTPQSILFSPR